MHDRNVEEFSAHGTQLQTKAIWNDQKWLWPSGLRGQKCIFQNIDTQIAVDLKQILSGFCAFPRKTKAGLGDSFCVCFKICIQLQSKKVWSCRVDSHAMKTPFTRLWGHNFGKSAMSILMLGSLFLCCWKAFGHTYADVVQTLISLEAIIWVAWGYCQLRGTYNTIVFQGRRVDC